MTDPNEKTARTSVFLLWHEHQSDDGSTDVKLLGVYSTRTRAEERIRRARELAGFRDQPEAFLVDEYWLDHDQWPDGYKVLED